MYKKELNLYNEKCRLKDEVISTLHACLDTYKLSNIKDNDLIMLLKAKITECRAKYDALRKTFDDQLADQKRIIVEQNDRIDKLVSELQNKEALITEMTEQHYREMEKSKMEISSKYEEQITELQISISERNMKLANNESAMKEYQDSIEQLEGTLDTERKGKEKETQSRVKLEASLRIREEQLKKQTDRLSQYFIKELHETLKAGNEGELKMTYLPHIGSMKIRAHHCFAGPEWIVIQRRTGNVVNFKQGWYSYVHGFGNLNGDFWYGLANIHDITKSQPHELYIHLVFPNNVVRYAYYDNFAISGQYCDYKLKTLGKFSGNAGDGLRTHKHEVFKSVRYSSQSVTQYNRWWQHANPNW